MTVSTKREDVERLRNRLRVAANNAWNGEAAAMLDALLAERDALQDEWSEIAAGITTEVPAVGSLWPMVSEVSGSLEAARNNFKNEVVAHNRTKTERDAARAEVERLREAGRPLHAAAVAAVGSLKPSDHKRAALAIACMDWRKAAQEPRHDR